MNDSIKIPVWFYTVAVIAIVWNAMGVMAYIGTVMMSAEDFLKMPEVQQSMQTAMPMWAKAAFAMAVFAGVIGSLMLLLKKSMAVPILIISLIAIIAQQINFIILMKGFDFIGNPAKIMTIMIIVVGFLLVWLAMSAKAKQWIK